MHRKSKKHATMQLQTLMLNALYNAGDAIGPILGYTFIILMTIELVYVFVKYVITSNK